MKKIFYRLASGRSFARLFSLLACVALGSLFAQPAVAQIFGWEPAPPSSWDGGWDATLSCGSVVGTTELTRTPPSGPDSVVQHGTVTCTFTDTARNFTETATCVVDPDNGPIQFGNLSESPASCANNGDGTSTLTITGTCPFKKGNALVGATGSGTIDCRGRNADGSINMNNNPKFCSYAGTNPNGNPPIGTPPNVTQDCRWNMGFGTLKSNGDVVPLTETECRTAFPATSELALSQVFKFTQRYSVPGCTGTEFAGVGPTTERFCHSDTWDGSKLAACTFPQGAPKNTVLGKLANHLTVDTEYQPTVSPNCGPQNEGVVNLSVFAVNRDPDHPDNNTVALELINQKTITVNGNSVATKSDGVTPACSFDVFPNPNVMTCNIKKCVNGHNIIDPNQISDGTSTLVMRASMLSDGSPIEGDIETVKVSGNAP
jgi:hypothetical protein